MPTFEAKAPGSACSAIADRLVDRDARAAGDRRRLRRRRIGRGGFSRLTSGSVTSSKAISTPLSVMNSITSDE